MAYLAVKEPNISLFLSLKLVETKKELKVEQLKRRTFTISDLSGIQGSSIIVYEVNLTKNAFSHINSQSS